MYLGGRYRPAGVILHDTFHNVLKLGVPITAPNKVVARELHEELVVTWRDGRGRAQWRVS